MWHYTDEHDPRLFRGYNDHLHYVRWNASGIDHQVLDSPEAVWSVSQGDRGIAVEWLTHKLFWLT